MPWQRNADVRRAGKPYDSRSKKARRLAERDSARFRPVSATLPCVRQFKPVRNPAHLSARAFSRPFPDLRADAAKRLFGLLSIQRALPDDDQIPSGVAPGLFVADVALDVLRPLLHPELDIGLRHGRILASVPVPETTAHVDYRLGARNDDIGPPGEALVAHPVPPTARKKALAHDHLRQGVPAANLRHQPAALLFCYAIHDLFSPETEYAPWHCIIPNRRRIKR